MARTKDAENAKDPATGKALPPGVTVLGKARYRARKLVKGSRVSRVFETARLAREWLEDTEAAVRRDEYVDRRPLANTTVRDLVERFVREVLVDGGVRRGAAEDRASHVPSILKDALANISLADLGPSDITAWRDRQLARHAPGTVLKRMNLLSTILSHARAEWRVPMKENPASAENAPRPRNADVARKRRLMPAAAVDVRIAQEEGRDVPPDEEARLLEAMAKSPCSHDILLVRFSIAQATRRGEALGLRWRDVDLDGRVLTLRGRHGRGTKTVDLRTADAERRPLMKEAVAVLRELLPENGKPDPEAAVFRVGTPNAFAMRFRRLCRDAGLDGLRYHDLRREATTRLAQRYTNPQDLRLVTGHSNTAMLARYYAPDLGELARRGEEEPE